MQQRNLNSKNNKPTRNGTIPKNKKSKNRNSLFQVLKKNFLSIKYNLGKISNSHLDEKRQIEIRRKNYQKKQLYRKKQQERLYHSRIKDYKKKEKRQNRQFEIQERKYNSDRNRQIKAQRQRALNLNLDLFSIRAGLDLPLLIITLVLLTVGLTMMFSASYPSAYNFYHDSYKFVRNQAVFAIIGFIVMLVISYFDYHHLKKFSKPILILSFILLIVVLLLPARNGVHRWIDLGGVSFQPSEIAKFAIVLFFAVYISENFNFMDTFKGGILPFAFILLPMLVLLLKEPHKSCMVIVILIAAVLMFIGGVRLKWFIGSSVFLFITAIVSIFLGKYSQDRMSGWGNALNFVNKAQWDSTWQTRNSLYAIGSGRLFGLGLGQSRMKHMYLPESYNDFIFAIVCEELGYIGAFIILCFFALLVWRGIEISMRAKDKFGTILGIGIISQIGIQALLNVAVVTDSIPNTGISLPFFSYGGTSLLMLLAQMGVLLSISRTSNITKI